MPSIKPFAAIRYNPDRVDDDLSGVLAPPYDVLDRPDKEGLLRKSDHNIVAIDLPHIPPKSAGPPEVYQTAARRLEQWLTDGLLVRDAAPALYLYHQSFEHAGRNHTRRMFIACVPLVPFSDGSVLPHEQTFGGPKEDRLALTKATRTQISPIFGLYADAEGAVDRAFSTVTDRAPTATGTLDRVENRLWAVTDRAVTDVVVNALSDKRIYIADGHHRYGTALLYREFVRSEHGGALPPDHPANYVMFVLASMDDPGCLIFPYHRVLAGVELSDLLSAWSDGVEPAERNAADIILDAGRSETPTPLRFTRREVLAELEPELVGPWRQLDYAYLHRYLMEELFASKIGTPDVRYVKSAEDARRTAKETTGVALLMNATPMAHLRAVSEAGGLMPQKSTYFYPKLATGLTIYPLA